MLRYSGEPQVLEEREDTAGAGEVLIQVAGCEVGHTDLGSYYAGVPARRPFPLMLGHQVRLRVSLPECSPDFSAQKCGECHLAVYEEWKQTIHSQAWTDPYFQVDWVFDKKNKTASTATLP